MENENEFEYHLFKKEYQKRLDELNLKEKIAKEKLENAKNEEERKEAESDHQAALNAIIYFVTHYVKVQYLDNI